VWICIITSCISKKKTVKHQKFVPQTFGFMSLHWVLSSRLQNSSQTIALWCTLSHDLILYVCIFQWTVVKHFVARAGCLIVMPAIIYMLIFYIHFAVLYKRWVNGLLFTLDLLYMQFLKVVSVTWSINWPYR